MKYNQRSISVVKIVMNIYNENYYDFINQNNIFC